MLKIILFALSLSRLGVDKHFAEIFLTLHLHFQRKCILCIFMDYYQPFSKLFKLVADARFRLNSYDGFSPVADPCGLTVLHLISIILKCTTIIRKALFEITVIRKFSENLSTVNTIGTSK